MDDGTPRALQPLADEVLAWVAAQRKSAPYQTEYDNPVPPDDIRRIELCAQAVINLDRLTASFTAEGVTPCACTPSA